MLPALDCDRLTEAGFLVRRSDGPGVPEENMLKCMRDTHKCVVCGRDTVGRLSDLHKTAGLEVIELLMQKVLAASDISVFSEANLQGGDLLYITTSQTISLAIYDTS